MLMGLLSFCCEDGDACLPKSLMVKSWRPLACMGLQHPNKLHLNS